MKRTCALGTVAVAAFGAVVPVSANASDSQESLFECGRYEAAMTVGALFSPFVATANRPTINYTTTTLQFGYMLTDVKGGKTWRGNVELVGEAFGDAVFEGEGSYIAGITVWSRFNFVPPRCRFVPYFQGGAGLAFTDIDRNVVGETFNFNLDLGVGVRCLIARNCSINLEYRYQHISNANLGPKDLGVNSHGPMLGFSVFF